MHIKAKFSFLLSSQKSIEIEKKFGIAKLINQVYKLKLKASLTIC